MDDRKRLRRVRGPQAYSAPCSMVDPSTIPVYINNRNRLSSLVTLVEWLRDSGTKRIVVIDNASTYPPLLEYYKKCMGIFEVFSVGKNGGPRVFWEQGMYKWQSTPYVVTDADLEPDKNCPKDLVFQLNKLLHERPECGKAGPGLRIDDIPYLGESEKLNGWSLKEQQPYWFNRYDSRAFFAPVDTTFALYGEGNPNQSQSSINLRMDFPYVFRHLPWYVTQKTMSEEEIYYRTHTEIGPWGETHPWSHNHQLLTPRDEHPWKDNPA